MTLMLDFNIHDIPYFPYGTLYLILSGFLIGLIVSAPMGPVGVLCVQRTTNKGRWFGFVTGVGAACSDMFYALITGFGMSFVSDLINNARNLFLLQMAGSVLLLIFGILSFRSHPQRRLRPASQKKGSLWYNFWTGFLVTLSNPLIIFLFIALFARFAFVVPDDPLPVMLGFAAIAGGAVTWWLLLTGAIERLSTRFGTRGIVMLNRTIGVIIMAVSVYGLATTLFGIKALSLIPH